MMGKLEERKDGYFVLDTKIGQVNIQKAFMQSDKPLDQISKEPKSNGFYLDIPDKEEPDNNISGKNDR